MYHDGSGEREIFSVDNVQFTADPDGPALYDFSSSAHCITSLPSIRIIRMSNFRDSLRLSAEWDGTRYPEEVIQKFLDNVASLMLSLN